MNKKTEKTEILLTSVATSAMIYEILLIISAEGRAGYAEIEAGGKLKGADLSKGF